ncbi:MAG: penicillin-binding protein activator [Pseudomonadota bacterium]
MIGIVLLAACESTPTRPPDAGVEVATPEAIVTASADALVNAAQAAPPETAAMLWLEAAAALVAESRLEEASAALAEAERFELDEDGIFERDAIAISMLLARNDLRGARGALRRLLPVTDDQDKRYRGLALELANRHRDPALIADRLLAQGPPPARAQFNNYIAQTWHHIGRAPHAAVQARLRGGPRQTRDWWQLRADMLAAFDHKGERRALLRWQATHPRHPLSEALPPSLAALREATPTQRHLVLLVPQSGPLAAAGRAVRDGFLAAQLHQGAAATHRITVLDSAAAPIERLYADAAALAPDAIVGPLDKKRVAQLNALNPEVPTLLLNYLPDNARPADKVLQLGIAVEDESYAIASRLRAENIERVLLLHNEKAWSLRAKEALLDALASVGLGGNIEDTTGALATSVVGVASSPSVTQLTQVVGRAFLVDGSHARHRRLQQILGTEIEFVPRARRDTDAVVAFLDGPEARALRPALKFHFSDHLPVYTSSQALRRVAKRDLRDLRGFNVCEIPWRLDNSGLKGEVTSAFSGSSGSTASLYALGIDAFRIGDRLPSALSDSSLRLLGATGELSIDVAGKLRRDLAWHSIGPDGLTPLPPPEDTTLPGSSTAAGE